MKNTISFMLMGFVICCHAGYDMTFGESIDVSSEAEKLDILLDNRDFCVDKIEEGKIYFKGEEVYVTDIGIFVRFDIFTALEVPEIRKDEKGYFISLTQ